MTRIGLTPVPDDGDVKKLLQSQKEEHSALFLETMEALLDTVNQTLQVEEPRIFAYGKLLNYLASDDITQTELIAIAAAGLWKKITED